MVLVLRFRMCMSTEIYNEKGNIYRERVKCQSILPQLPQVIKSNGVDLGDRGHD